MRRLPLYALALTAWLTTHASALAADYPTTVLKNTYLQVTLRLPDANKGFYRGTRFDWSGVIGPVEVHGKKIFNPWKGTHNPTNNDDITGPVDEFSNSAPLNFHEAKEGERFLKIGVGELTKGKDNEYSFFKNYAIAKPGQWKVDVGSTKVTFHQTLKTDFGYAYDYTKTVSLVSRTSFRIRYRFKNIGEKKIETDVYNHNFFNVDGAGTGKGFGVTFAFTPNVKEGKERFNELVERKAKSLEFKDELDTGSIYAILDGYGDSDKDAKFSIRGGGVQMNVTGNRPLTKVAFWGMKSTLCPEPYIAIKLAPGEEMTWNWTYDFALTK